MRAPKTQVYCTQCKKKFIVAEILVEKTAKTAEANAFNQKKNNAQITSATADNNPVLTAENKPDIPPALIAEAKAEFIPKEDPRQLQNAGKNRENQAYSAGFGGVLKKSNTRVAAVTTPQAPPQEPLPWENKNSAIHPNWSIGVAAAALMLIGQALYFEAPKLSQSPLYRPLMEKFCQWSGIALADYENLSDLIVMTSSFIQQPDNSVVFKTVINNQAPFRQRIPNIQLNLLNYNEQLIAQRVFNPLEYLTRTSSRLTLLPDETVEATLVIAAPTMPVGGYNFNLVY